MNQIKLNKNKNDQIKQVSEIKLISVDQNKLINQCWFFAFGNPYTIASFWSIDK